MATKRGGNRAGQEPVSPPSSLAEARDELQRLCESEGESFWAAAGAVAFPVIQAVRRKAKRLTARELDNWLSEGRPAPPCQTDRDRARRLAGRIIDSAAERYHLAGLTILWTEAEEVSIVLAPGDAGLSIAAGLHSHFGGDERRPHSLEDFFRFLIALRRETPFLVPFVAGSAIELLFLEQVSNPARLSATLAEWCGEIVTENGPPHGIGSAERRIARERRVRLWWD